MRSCLVVILVFVQINMYKGHAVCFCTPSVVISSCSRLKPAAVTRPQLGDPRSTAMAAANRFSSERNEYHLIDQIHLEA
jgi:hypothetical protein